MSAIAESLSAAFTFPVGGAPSRYAIAPAVQPQTLPAHLRQLESEAIYVLREVAAQFERPALLFSGGKDSIVLVELARRAFAPANSPFPLIHIDTGHNFIETLEFRDALAKRTGMRLIVRSVED